MPWHKHDACRSASHRTCHPCSAYIINTYTNLFFFKLYAYISFVDQFVQRVAHPFQVHSCFWKGLARNFNESILPFFVTTDTRICRRIRRPPGSSQKLDFVNGLLSIQRELVHRNHDNAFKYGRMTFTLVVHVPYNNWCRRSWWYKRFPVCFLRIFTTLLSAEGRV